MSGRKFDGGKTRYELLPPEFLEGTARVLTFGAKKYADRNWETGIAYSRAYGALQRHLWAWWHGEDLDDETGMSHLWHAACELAFLTAFEARNRTDLDDRACKAGIHVSPLRGASPPAPPVAGEDEQPVSGGDGGLLVLGAGSGSVDRVQVLPDPAQVSWHPSRLESAAGAVAQREKKRG